MDGYIVADLADEAVVPSLRGAVATLVDYRDWFDPLRSLKVPGVHNQKNAAAALAAAAQVGIKAEEAAAALANFTGTWRRFEYKGIVNGAKVYDDYGHHPTEITATIKGARELYPDKKITLVFQSHTYTRTNELFKDFVTALETADQVYVLPIYAARETNLSGVTHTALAQAVGDKAEALPDFVSVVSKVKSLVGEDDIVLVMGAGDVTEIANRLVS